MVKPALQSTLGGEGFLGMLAVQVDTNQAGTPGGVLAAKTQGFLLKRTGSSGGGRGTARVTRSDCVSAANPEAAQQVTYGAGSKGERFGDGRNALPLFRPLPDYLTQGKRDRMWHEQSSLEVNSVHEPHGTLPPIAPAAPAAGKRQNQLSHLSGKTGVVFKRQNWCRI
jgi:hypothetical protein